MSRSEIMDGFRALADAIDIGFKANQTQIAQIQSRVEDLRTEMRAGFAQVDRRLARLDDRVSVLEDDASQLKDGVCRLNGDMSRVEAHLGITD